MKDRGNEPTLIAAETLEDFEAFGSVCRAYEEWCRERDKDMPWFVEEVFGYQACEEELKELAQKYGQSAGRTILVRGDDGVVAGGAYRRLSDTACELKRIKPDQEYPAQLMPYLVFMAKPLD